MTDTTAPTQTESPETADTRTRSVIIRPWPKVVFLWPTLVMALFCWAWQAFGGGTETVSVVSGDLEGQLVEVKAANGQLGFWFLCVFFFNLLVFSFDFGRIKSITILLLVVVAILTVFQLGIAQPLVNTIGGINVRMNDQFYAFISAFLLAVGVLIVVNTRFNYFEVNHREILHHQGYMSDTTRYPTQGLQLNKEIYDMMEFMLMGSGRLVFNTPGRREAIVIDNVMGVNKVERRLNNLLSVVAVRVTPDQSV